MASSLPGPHNIHTGQLSNGLRVWVYENFESQTVILDGYAPGGTVDEGPENPGLAEITATMLRRGTAHRSYDALNQAAEERGAFFGFDAGWHHLSFNAYALAEDFEAILALLAESLLHPAFPQDELEKVRQDALTHLEQRKYSTRGMALYAFHQQVFPPGHPYHEDLEGEMEAVRRFRREDLIRFYQEKVTPTGGVIVVVGAVPTVQVLETLERFLGSWRHPQAQPDFSIPPRPQLAQRTSRHVHVRGKSQSDIVLGWPGIARTDPDFDGMLVCNTILGRFGMGGRLGRRIRQEMGLAYYASSTFSASRGARTWRLQAGVHPRHVEDAVAAMLAEVTRIIQQPVTPQELEDAHHYLIGSLPLRLESNGGIARNLVTMALYDLGMDYLQTYADRIRRVDQDTILRVARTYLHPDRYALAVAGPWDEEG